MTRRPELPRFANVRTGDMAQHERPTFAARWLVIVAIGCALAGGFGVLAFGDVPDPYMPAPGFEPCLTKGC